MKITSSRHLLVLGAAVFGGAFGFINQSFATSAWDLTTVQGFTNGSWAFGEKFTVGSTSLLVDALGALDVGHNGFVTSGGVAVGLYKEDGTFLASTTVTSGDTLVGNYRFGSIGPITLDAGEQYRVIGVSGSDLYNIDSNPNLVVDPRITWNGYAYGSSSTLIFSNTNTGNDISWFANFNIAGEQNNSVPDGGSSVAMVGLALVGLAALRRRR